MYSTVQYDTKYSTVLYITALLYSTVQYIQYCNLHAGQTFIYNPDIMHHFCLLALALVGVCAAEPLQVIKGRVKLPKMARPPIMRVVLNDGAAGEEHATFTRVDGSFEVRRAVGVGTTGCFRPSVV